MPHQGQERDNVINQLKLTDLRFGSASTLAPASTNKKNGLPNGGAYHDGRYGNGGQTWTIDANGDVNRPTQSHGPRGMTHVKTPTAVAGREYHSSSPPSVASHRVIQHLGQLLVEVVAEE